MREDITVTEAIEYLMSRTYRPYPVEMFRKALDIEHPYTRYEAASKALLEIRKQHWCLRS